MTDSLLEKLLTRADTAIAAGLEGLGYDAVPLPCRPRQERGAVVWAGAFPLAASAGADPRTLAAALASSPELSLDWLDRAEAQGGYVNLIPSSRWYRGVAEEILAGTPDIPAAGANTLFRPENGPVLESRDTPAYALWYAYHRAALKGPDAGLSGLGPMEKQALFLLAALPREARRASLDKDPDRLGRYLADAAGLFFSYERWVRRGEASHGLYPCFLGVLDRGLRALGIRWNPKHPWGERNMEASL